MALPTRCSNRPIWISFRAALLTFLFGLGPTALLRASDGDADGDVDLADLALLVPCVAGPEVAPVRDCNAFDSQPDGAVDMEDVAAFQAAFKGDGVIVGSLDVDWIHGSADCNQNQDPPIQVHKYNKNYYILRQNKCINYEGPFITLIFGDDKVFMQDTGATSSPALFPLADTVWGLINDWLKENGKQSIQLIVTHSHSHGDHVAADGQFIGLPNTVVVGKSQGEVAKFFGITNWPDQIVEYDLGGRVLDIIPIPGHHGTSIAVYDRATDILLTGDSLYPGRLYIQTSLWSVEKASIQRLVDFAAKNNIVWVLGTHIEMTDKPGQDYKIGTKFQPREHLLQLEKKHLIELNDALIKLGNTPALEVHDDFIIYPLGS